LRNDHAASFILFIIEPPSAVCGLHLPLEGAADEGGWGRFAAVALFQTSLIEQDGKPPLRETLISTVYVILSAAKNLTTVASERIFSSFAPSGHGLA
jgi:hypothetical protein